MTDEKTPPIEAQKPVVKSWDAMRKEAKAIQRDKLLKKLTKEQTVESHDQAETSNQLPDKNETPVEEKKDKTPESKPEEPKLDIEAVTKQAALEAAQTVAEAAKADKLEFQTKLDAILQKDADLQQKQKDSDELIAAWDKEGRLPKDYKEYIAEGLRINEARWNQLDRERAAKFKVEEPKTEPKSDPQKTDLELANFQKEIQTDLEDLYSAKFLSRPTSTEEINNPETADPAAKETQKLFEFGVKLNTERVAKGLAPVKSLSKIYFLHYKPTIEAASKKSAQPAGADAPISPSRNQSVTEQNQPTPFYQKGEDGHYRPKSWAQIKYEALKSRINR